MFYFLFLNPTIGPPCRIYAIVGKLRLVNLMYREFWPIACGASLNRPYVEKQAIV